VQSYELAASIGQAASVHEGPSLHIVDTMDAYTREECGTDLPTCENQQYALVALTNHFTRQGSSASSLVANRFSGAAPNTAKPP
jgi:hypothetical protein